LDTLILPLVSLPGDFNAVCFHKQNRRDKPDPEGPPYFDFPGLSTLWHSPRSQTM